MLLPPGSIQLNPVFVTLPPFYGVRKLYVPSALFAAAVPAPPNLDRIVRRFFSSNPVDSARLCEAIQFVKRQIAARSKSRLL